MCKPLVTLRSESLLGPWFVWRHLFRGKDLFLLIHITGVNTLDRWLLLSSFSGWLPIPPLSIILELHGHLYWLVLSCSLIRLLLLGIRWLLGKMLDLHSRFAPNSPLWLGLKIAEQSVAEHDTFGFFHTWCYKYSGSLIVKVVSELQGSHKSVCHRWLTTHQFQPMGGYHLLI